MYNTITTQYILLPVTDSLFPNLTSYDVFLNLKERYQKMDAESIDYTSRYGMANSPFWSNLFEQFDPGYTGVAVKHYYPFFDLRLVNFLVSIPPVPWLVNKNILREAMKGRLPEAIRTRKKIVFEVSDQYTKGIQEMVGLWIGDLLKNAPLLEDYVNTAELSQFLQSEEIDIRKFMGLEKTLAVAYWLRNSQVVSSNKVKLEAVSY